MFVTYQLCARLRSRLLKTDKYPTDKFSNFLSAIYSGSEDRAASKINLGPGPLGLILYFGVSQPQHCGCCMLDDELLGTFLYIIGFLAASLDSTH